MKKSITDWQKTFGTEPMKITPDTKNLEESWEKMGQVFGQIQLQKQQYKRAGLTEAVAEIDKKLDEKKKQLEEQTIDLMGYPRLFYGAKEALQKSAREDDLYLNIYKLEEYKKIPPANIASAIMEAKQYFDRLEIWAIEEKPYVRPIKDPAVIGYVRVGYADVPYLIATWGEDIKPEDLANVEKELEVVNSTKVLPSTSTPPTT